MTQTISAELDDVLNEMLRRMDQPKYIDHEGGTNPDWLPNDDTQIGVEFAVEYLSALRAQPQGSEAVAVWKHLPDGNNWLVVQPKFRGMEWPAEVPLYASPPVQAQPRGVMKWDGHPTPSEAAELLRAYARKKRLPPSDNNFEDAAGIIDTLSALASPPSPVDGGVTDEMVEQTMLLVENYVSANLREARGSSKTWENDIASVDKTKRLLFAALTAGRVAIRKDTP